MALRDWGSNPLTSIWQLLRFLPQLIRLRSDRSVYSLVAKHIKDPYLRQVMSFHPLLIGGNPFSVTGIYSLISHLEQSFGVWSAMGGTGSLVDGFTKLIESQGSEIHYNTEVQRITTDGRRVTGVALQGGRELQADIVVSNADSAWTYRYLLPESQRKRWTIEGWKTPPTRMDYTFGTSERNASIRTYPITRCCWVHGTRVCSMTSSNARP